jgi:hypothetical protein
MSYDYSVLQAGSGVIGSASGNTVIVRDGDADLFGIGATLILWPAGETLDSTITNYETMLIDDKTGSTLTVIRGSQDDPTGLDTWAEGDQIALSFPSVRISSNSQIQVLTAGKTAAMGPVLDLGVDARGLVFVAATISDVDLDGGTPGAFQIDIDIVGSFDGTSWGTLGPPFDPTIGTASGSFANPASSLFSFTADDPAPLYGHLFAARYIRFVHNWPIPSDIGVNASATITFELNYY